MSPDDTDIVIALLTGAGLKGTDTRYTDASAPQWTNHLVPLEFHTAVAAADSIIGRVEWFPTIAEFMDHYRAERRRREAEQLMLPAPAVPITVAHRGLAAARAALAATRGPQIRDDSPVSVMTPNEPESPPPDVEHRATLTGTDEAGE